MPRSGYILRAAAAASRDVIFDFMGKFPMWGRFQHLETDRDSPRMTVGRQKTRDFPSFCVVSEDV